MLVYIEGREHRQCHAHRATRSPAIQHRRRIQSTIFADNLFENHLPYDGNPNGRFSLPDTKRHLCWFCNYRNTPTATQCGKCKAQTPPSRGPNNVEIIYKFLSFGPRADSYHSEIYPRLQATLLGECFNILRNTDRIVVRVGDGTRTSIGIHDPNGVFRCSNRFDSVVENQEWVNDGAILENVCRMTLEPDQETGK